MDSSNVAERRSRRRYPLTLTVTSRDGLPLGRTVDISSHAVAIQSVVRPSHCIAIAWPVLLDEHCPLRLMITGEIVRRDGDVTVLAIKHHEFRTAGRLAAAG